MSNKFFSILKNFFSWSFDPLLNWIKFDTHHLPVSKSYSLFLLSPFLKAGALSYFLLPTFYFLLFTFYFLLFTSYFLLFPFSFSQSWSFELLSPSRHAILSKKTEAKRSKVKYIIDPLPTCQDVVPTNRDEGWSLLSSFLM